MEAVYLNYTIVPAVKHQGNDQYTELLLPFSGTNAATTTRDMSRDARVVTLAGGAAIHTSHSMFNNGSLYCGDSGDYCTIAASSTWNFSTNPFTWDLWVSSYTSGAIDRWLMTIGADADNWAGLWYDYDNEMLKFTIETAGVEELNVSEALEPNDSDWHHIAIERDSNTFTLFLDGAVADSDTYAGAMPDYSAQVFYINKRIDKSATTNIFFDEVRISSIARYGGAAFNVMSGAYF